VLLVAFVATLITTFPVGPIVRWALARADVDPSTIAFDTAHLRWDGIQLDRVTIDTGQAQPIELPWLRVRPSLFGLVRRGDGLPATVTARVCDGWLDGRAEPAANGRRFTGVWTDVDLAQCGAGLGIPGDVSGFVQGRIDLTIDAAGDRHGTGLVHLRDLDWHVPGVPRHVPTRADTADLQWDVAGPTVAVRRFEIRNDELDAAATGTIRLATPLVESALALDVTISPRSGMPQAHRDFLAELPGGPPNRHGQRRFHVAGTVGEPVLERPS
jgi:type II secretion system protein N